MNVAGKDADSLYDQLSAIAPTVATQGTGVYWKQDFLLVADGVGKTQQAAALLDTFNTDAAALGASLSSPPTVSFTRQNGNRLRIRSEEHTSELQSLMRISYAVFCLKKKNHKV